MIAAFAASAILSLTATCYTPESSGSVMADGQEVSFGSVAMNTLPLGSKIKVLKPRRGFFGRKIFYVRDRIGWGTELDFWYPSESECLEWGRQNVVIRVLRIGRG